MPRSVSTASTAAAGPAKPQPPATPASYEAALAELEQLLAQVEAGQAPLDAMLANYQRAAVLLEYCRSRLHAVEQHVQILEEGQIKPWMAT